MHADPAVVAWLARGPMSVDEASDVIAHFDAHGFGPWALERRADAMLIGVCGLSHEVRATHPMAPCVEIVWRQARPAWGHGYVAGRACAAPARRVCRPRRRSGRRVTAHACSSVSATCRSAARSGSRRHPRKSGRIFPSTD
ncbi:GNAT family N-acetyltransferase [Burkholderia sp. LMG 21824]|uniref:GNAT family N-acetyltransferase n=1 Tax=Burkholderia sp. LMG 21824 TaxID=3158172 RepID=UPI003C2CC910